MGRMGGIKWEEWDWKKWVGMGREVGKGSDGKGWMKREGMLGMGLEGRNWMGGDRREKCKGRDGREGIEGVVWHGIGWIGWEGNMTGAQNPFSMFNIGEFTFNRKL